MLAVILCMPVAASAQQQPPRTPGTLRTGVTAVPVDVRVFDRGSRPVTNLTRAVT